MPPIKYTTPEQTAAEMLQIVSDPAQAMQATFMATIPPCESPTLQDFALCARLVSKRTTTDKAVEIVHAAWDAEERRRLHVKMPTRADILRALTTRDCVRIIKKDDQWRAIDEQGDILRNWSARPTLTQTQAEDNFLKACPLASLLTDSDDEGDDEPTSASPYPDRERFGSD